MESWDDLRFLLAVSKTGSMTGAASILKTSVATVSRRLDKISENLGTPPFIKTSDGWVPSAAVTGLIELAVDFEGNLKRELNSQQHSGNEERAKVDIRISAPPSILLNVLSPGLPLRDEAMNYIRFDMHDRIFGEGLGETDILISGAPPSSGRVLTRKIAQMTFALYGGAGKGPFTDWVGLGTAHDQDGIMKLGFDHFKCPPVLRADTIGQMAELVKRSGYPGPLPYFLAQEIKNLWPINADRYNAEIWISYHESRRGDPAITQTLDWINRCFDNVKLSESDNETTNANVVSQN